MVKQYDVIVVGELNVDLILNQINRFPVIGKEVLANQMTLTLGSSSAIFAANLKTLGATVTYVGKLGRDSFGELIISSLKNKGVDTGNIIFTETCSTGATVVMNMDEDRANLTYPGAMSQLCISDIDDVTLRNEKHLHVSSIFLQEGLIADISNLFRRAKQIGLTTSLDPQWDPSEKWDVDLKTLLEYVDIFIPNMEEFKALTKTTNLQDAIQTIAGFNKLIVIKDSRNGAYLWNGQELTHQPPFLNTTVVDCIGAGDSFDAGFICKFLQKNTLDECLRFAALAGAINTTCNGGTGAFESLEKVKQIAQSNFNCTI